jgi:mannitol-1-phosphate 5-dehydrogenase
MKILSNQSKNYLISTKKLVLFGAGKIGRSFIGQLFGCSGFEVVFVDKNKSIIDEINRKRNYNVIIKTENEEIINVKDVRGIHADFEEEVKNEIATARILAVSVGLEGLSEIFPLISGGLMKRFEIDSKAPLDIIIAENIRNGSKYFKGELRKLLPKWFPVDNYVGTIETSIGKMVPIMLKKDVEQDLLQVFAESYNTLILDRKAFKNSIPNIIGLSPKENIKAWVDLKLFVHNLGHASAAYLGYMSNPDFIYLHEALSTPEIYNLVKKTMLQSANILLIKYPDEFTGQMLVEHIDDLLGRFQNKELGDTIFRVGRDLFRKLGPDDRLTGSIKLAIDLNQPFNKILFILICASRFRATDEDGNLFVNDSEFMKLFNEKTNRVLSDVCGFDPIKEKQVFIMAEKIIIMLQKYDFKSCIQKIISQNY